MSTQRDYDWRTASFTMLRSGYLAVAEKFWCTEKDGDDDGWRWLAYALDSGSTPRALVSEQMSLVEAKRRAEEWISAQIDREKSRPTKPCGECAGTGRVTGTEQPPAGPLGVP